MFHLELPSNDSLDLPPYDEVPAPHRIGVVKGDQPVARSCHLNSVRHHVLKNKERESMSIHLDDGMREEKSRPIPVEGFR